MQMDLIHREKVLDRNYDKGGRSFYFFDLDDNVWNLPSKVYLYHQVTGGEIGLSTREFTEHQEHIGRRGRWGDYMVDPNDGKSYRRFRDRQSLLDDVQDALKHHAAFFRGPSWDFFYHAVYNERPVSIITARGHDPKDFEDAFQLLVDAHWIPCKPQWVDIIPVTHEPTRRARLADSSLELPTSILKRNAIFECVRSAFEKFGGSGFHRFGMSDDDPRNLMMIRSAMHQLKVRHPENAFFVISSTDGKLQKEEVHLNASGAPETLGTEQLTLF